MKGSRQARADDEDYEEVGEVEFQNLEL